jgi:2-methylcitrate dehydratase PrpD
MAHQQTARLLSYTIAEWACALKYEHLSPEAIQAAKLFWFDSIGCALGGSQQDDAKILLKHYRAMGSGKGNATAFVSALRRDIAGADDAGQR